MQPTDNFGVSRRALDVEDYIDILRRHKGWVFGPFLFITVLAVAGVHLWPDSYTSVARMQITPQQIPEQMVPAQLSQALADRIGTMAATIRSRTNLTQIINNFELYTAEQAEMPMQDVIELMDKNIGIQVMQSLVGSRNSGEFPAFEVSFTYRDRHLAQSVVDELVSRFVSENVQSSSRSTFQTEEFVQSRLEQAEAALREAQDRLTNFRLANNGRLPDQLASNAQQLQSLNNQTQMQLNAKSRAEQEIVGLQTQRGIFQDELEKQTQEVQQVAQVAATNTQNQRVLAQEREVERLETQLELARQRLTDIHPDVKVIQDAVALARQRLVEIETEEASKVVDEPEVPLGPSIDQQRQLRRIEQSIVQIDAAIQAKKNEIADIDRSLTTTNSQIGIYQSRLASTPVGEQEYETLERARKIAEADYLQWKETLSQAQVANEVQDRAQGERLVVLDRASLPTNPAEPNRPMVMALGAGFGLLVGLVIAGAREMKDTTLKNLKDVRAYTQMAILGSVPLLENDFVVKRRKRIAWLGWTAACLVSVVVMAGTIAFYYTTQGAT